MYVQLFLFVIMICACLCYYLRFDGCNRYGPYLVGAVASLFLPIIIIQIIDIDIDKLCADRRLGGQRVSSRGGTIPEITMRYVSRYLSHDTIRITILH